MAVLKIKNIHMNIITNAISLAQLEHIFLQIMLIYAKI